MPLFHLTCTEIIFNCSLKLNDELEDDMHHGLTNIATQATLTKKPPTQ